MLKLLTTCKDGCNHPHPMICVLLLLHWRWHWHDHRSGTGTYPNRRYPLRATWGSSTKCQRNYELPTPWTRRRVRNRRQRAHMSAPSKPATDPARPAAPTGPGGRLQPMARLHVANLASNGQVSRYSFPIPSHPIPSQRDQTCWSKLGYCMGACVCVDATGSVVAREFATRHSSPSCSIQVPVW